MARRTARQRLRHARSKPLRSTSGLALLAAGAALAMLATLPTNAAIGARDQDGGGSLETQVLREPHAIDADTLLDRASGERFRLLNIDAPESADRAQCPAERALAARATQAARSAISRARSVEAQRMGRKDRYGRTLAVIRVDGRDLGQDLMAQGLARPWRGRREAWCGPGGELLF